MRANYGDVAIGRVQVCRKGSTCIVQAKVCPEHKTKATNYTVKLTIDEVNQKIIDGACIGRCTAALGNVL